MKISELENKKILIAGYGIEGKTTHEFLKKTVPSATVSIADRATDGESYLDNQNEFDLIIKTPGIPQALITIPHTTATNIFFANLNPRHTTVGVTGTKGKSTTASLIHHILVHREKSSELLGNIGRPMLEALIHPPEEDTIFVIELSSYQLDDIAFSPDISVVVSLYPDHIPYHGSVDAYFEAKHRIIAHADFSDFFVYNPAFSVLSDWGSQSSVRSLPYESSYTPTHSPLIGEHNQDNVRAALTVTNILGISYEQSDETLDTFQSLPHRLEKVGTFRDITFYDDAISTTPESTIAGLQAIPATRTILLGGEDRGYDFATLVAALVKHPIEAVILFPETGARIKSELAKIENSSIEIYETSSMKEAVALAFAHTNPDSVCLLSCASPSYSLWKNFVEKGNQFQQFIKEYATEA